jgi:hypothetical protein
VVIFGTKIQKCDAGARVYEEDPSYRGVMLLIYFPLSSHRVWLALKRNYEVVVQVGSL